MAQDVRVAALLHVKPGEEETVMQAALACAEPSRAEATNHVYTFNRDSDDKSLFVFIEHWASRAALDAHMQTPHFKAFAAAIEGKLARPIQVHILDPL